jgi:hypothetical protein
LKSFLTQTKREKIGTIDGLNLFFGALLGANLGTLDGLNLRDYVNLIFLLAGTVVALRIVSTSERRVYALLTLALYLVLLSSVMLLPGRRLNGMAEADLHRLGATVAIWVTAILLMEFWPVRDSTAAVEDRPEPDPS